MTSRARVFRNASFTTAQTAFSAVLLFLLYRYLLRTIGVEQLGVWSIVLATTSAARITDLGVSGSVVRFVARYLARHNLPAVNEVIGTSAISIGVSIGVLLLVLFPLLAWVLSRILPAHFYSLGLEVLPYALLSLWLTIEASVFQSGLDGSQRIDLRNLVVAFGNLLYLGIVVAFVPRFGLMGLAYAQIIQSFAILLISAVLLKNQLRGISFFPPKWSAARLRELASYGLNFQIAAGVSMLFDFTTKALLGKFGTLSDVGYYDMASRMVLQVRALVVTANQTAVPFVAHLAETAPNRILAVYQQSVRLLTFVLLPLFGTVIALIPAISVVWIGWPEPSFMLFAVLLCLGWQVNALNGPAYFANQATGHLTWNTIGQLAIGILNLTFGLLLGQRLGSLGVVIGWVCALAIGSMVVVAVYHRANHLPLSLELPPRHALLTFATAVEILIGWMVFRVLYGNVRPGILFVITVVVVCVWVIPVVWIHPIRRTFMKGLFERAGSTEPSGDTLASGLTV